MAEYAKLSYLVKVNGCILNEKQLRYSFEKEIGDNGISRQQLANTCLRYILIMRVGRPG